MNDKKSETNNNNNKDKTEVKVESRTDVQKGDKTLEMSEEELHLYPERRGDKIKKNWLESMVDREDYNKIICEQKVYDVIQKSIISLDVFCISIHISFQLSFN